MWKRDELEKNILGFLKQDKKQSKKSEQRDRSAGQQQWMLININFLPLKTSQDHSWRPHIFTNTRTKSYYRTSLFCKYTLLYKVILLSHQHTHSYSPFTLDWGVRQLVTPTGTSPSWSMCTGGSGGIIGMWQLSAPAWSPIQPTANQAAKQYTQSVISHTYLKWSILALNKQIGDFLFEHNYFLSKSSTLLLYIDMFLFISFLIFGALVYWSQLVD